VPWGLLRLVEQSLTRPHAEIRPALLAYLEHMAQDPRTALVELGQVNRLASPVLSQLSNVLVLYRGSLRHYPDDNRPREVLARLVSEFLDEADSTDYHDLQAHLLDFCLREALTPEQVAEVTDDPALASQINNDRPLRCVCLGCQMFGM
jgi:hypothetical protein